MRLHRITEAEVESAIQHPEFIEPSAQDRFNAWVEASGKFLRVTYKEEKGEIWVISAVKKKKKWR